MQIQNPVLRGFHPDPSLIRVKQDYYLAVSTFEWFPGVRIYHSANLADWKYYCSPISNISQADLRGTAPSDGIWAPCLSYDGDYFYLIYTVSHGSREFWTMDMANYLIRTKDLKGFWSEPVYLNSSGFDPSLFHDDNGRKYLLNMEWDYRKQNGKGSFAGVLLQEYDSDAKCLIGKPRCIFRGSEIGLTEGPHLYKRDGFYYLVCAEGGTGWFHAVTAARSRNLEGPYEICPENPILTSWKGSFDEEQSRKELLKYRFDEDLLQKAGHASFVETEDNRWYMAHLCARPIYGKPCCPMGRETAILELEWKEGWPVLKGGGRIAEKLVSIPDVPDRDAFAGEHKIYYFRDEDFLEDFQTLRIPYEQTGMSIYHREGYLRIYGQESIFSRYYQALIARRQTELCFRAEVCFEFHPESYQHCAGLCYRYDEKNQLYAFVTYEEKWEREAACLWSVKKGAIELMFMAPVDTEEHCLEVQVKNDKARFFYLEQGLRKPMGEAVSIEHMSDDQANGFTGCFVGMCVQDLRSREIYADFRSFQYDGFPDLQEGWTERGIYEL